MSGLVQADFTKLAAVDATAAELNIMDGDTSASSTTIVDVDRVVLNDNGTMKQVAVTDLTTYFSSNRINTITANASQGAGVIITSAVSIPGNSIIKKITAIITTNISVYASGSNIGLNLGTGNTGPARYDIIDDVSGFGGGSMGYGVLADADGLGIAIKANRVFELAVDNKQEHTYLTSSPFNVYCSISNSSTTFTAGGVTFIIEYIKY